MRVGVRAVPHTDAEMQVISATLLTPVDVAVGISHSGESQDVLHALKVAKEAGARTVAITNHPASPMARLADISLCTAAQEALAHGYPLGARVAQVGLIDVLYTCMALKRQTEVEHSQARIAAALQAGRADASEAQPMIDVLHETSGGRRSRPQPRRTRPRASWCRNHVGTLPVVDEQGVLVGVVRLEDLLQVFMPDFVALLDNIDFVHDFGALETLRPQDVPEAAELTMRDLMQPPVAVEQTCGLAARLCDDAQARDPGSARGESRPARWWASPRASTSPRRFSRLWTQSGAARMTLVSDRRDRHLCGDVCRDPVGAPPSHDRRHGRRSRDAGGRHAPGLLHAGAGAGRHRLQHAWACCWA